MEQIESKKEIASALILFHSIMPSIAKDGVNPHFRSRYASLPQVLDAIKEPLQECGLTFWQVVDGMSIITTIFHAKSGESISGAFPLNPVKNDPQGVGSAITYARRYSLVAMLGLNVDDDDDGNKASTPPQVQVQSQEIGHIEQQLIDAGCPKCNAPMKLSKEGKPYCSATCWIPKK